MKKEYIAMGIIAVIAAAVDSAVIWAIPSLAFTFSLATVALLILTFTASFEEALLFAVGQGVLIDLFSPTLFGAFIFSGIAMVVVITLLKKTWFKQTSMLTVTLLSSLSLLTGILVLLLLHGIASWLSILSFNPLAVITLASVFIGMTFQCILVNIVLRVFSVFQKFVLI